MLVEIKPDSAPAPLLVDIGDGSINENPEPVVLEPLLLALLLPLLEVVTGLLLLLPSNASISDR